MKNEENQMTKNKQTNTSPFPQVPTQLFGIFFNFFQSTTPINEDIIE